MQLLAKVLDNDDVELAGELTRFLGPVPKGSGDNGHNHNDDSSGLIEIGITPDDEEYCI